MKRQDIFQPFLEATKLEIFDETSGRLPVIFVATKPGTCDEMSGHVSALLVAKKTGCL